MISVKICDPESKNEFMEFIHGTTCIVAVPHGADSELLITSELPCTLVIEASGQVLKLAKITPPGDSLAISELLQPLARNGFGLADVFKFGIFKRKPQSNTPRQRLYNFQAKIHAGSPENPGRLLATFDFHLLCEVDFHWARAFHLGLKSELLKGDGESLGLAERVEGTCPHCHEVRARLEKDWRYD